uniref:Uncharacterized protein n=1 Tax=Anguilla anguilla TaxID=7936 RepID=A0A0E9VRQ1_ANGAN
MQAAKAHRANLHRATPRRSLNMNFNSRLLATTYQCFMGN